MGGVGLPSYRNLLFFVYKYFRQAQKCRKFFNENFASQIILSRNIDVRKRHDENFPNGIFGVEMNANENKANYGIGYFFL